MSGSSGSTVPFTPESFSRDVTSINETNVFARLSPLSQNACAAYDATVTAVAKHEKFEHNRQYLEAVHCSKRARSVFTEDGETGDPTESEPKQWVGSFTLSLSRPPRHLARGWYLGTGRGESFENEVDLLLAPPTDEWTKLGVAGKHARFFLNPEIGRIMLEARHTVFLGSDSTQTLTQSAIRVLAPGELICIGDCAYSFEYTELFTTRAFEEQLSQFMKNHLGAEWSLNNLVSPSSVGRPAKLGDYHCTPRAFDEGTFGKVTAGWTPKGTTIAIKQFKNPKQADIRAHKTMMEHIGIHENILQLIECVSDFSTKVPNAYCVYAPLAMGNLDHIIRGYQADSAVKSTLLRDYLRGLSYLHDQKHVMHLDLKPSNLAVLSLDYPKGVILDLDSATADATSTDHMKGTIPYLAPEVIKLKAWEESKSSQRPPPFDKSVDIWALGLSMYALHFGRPWHWGYFVPRDQVQMEGTRADRVTIELHSRFRHQVREARNASTDSIAKFFLGWIESMTEYNGKDRPPATELFELVSAVPVDKEQGRIRLKSGQKRGREE